MNKVILIGRLTKDPEVRYTNGENSMCVAGFNMAVDRRIKKDGDQAADFISCKAFGKLGEFSEKYLKKGTKIAIEGRIQTGSYTNKDGNKVYTTDVVADNIEFAESKSSSAAQNSEHNENPSAGRDTGFMSIPDDIDLPFA